MLQQFCVVANMPRWLSPAPPKPNKVLELLAHAIQHTHVGRDLLAAYVLGVIHRMLRNTLCCRSAAMRSVRQ